MSWEIVFVFALLVFAIASFIVEKIPPDLTAISVFGALLFVSMVTGSERLPALEATLDVFSNSAPLTIAAMFIISRALEKTGALELVTTLLRRFARLPFRIFMFLMILGVGAVSAFVNNTPVVIVLMPVILALARDMKVPASKLLIPLSYASIFGGTCTLLGTSTNLLASGILRDNGHPPIRMFELAAVGVPILVVGSLYLVVFGRRLLPVRETLTAILSEEERKEYMTEAFVRPGSRLIGQSLKGSGLGRSRGVRVLEIIRHGVALRENAARTVLEAGDRLVLACRASGIAEAHATKGITLPDELSESLETIAADEGTIVEGVLAPQAGIIGKTIDEINFRQRFRMVVIAVHRKGINQRERLGTLHLEAGDTLLMMGSSKALESMAGSDEVILLDRSKVPARSLRGKMPISIATAAGVVALASFDLVPIVAAVALGVAVLLLTGCLKPKEAYASIEWSILMIIFGMLALGQAMDSTGASALIASQMVGLAQFAPVDWQPILLLALVYLITSAFTEFLSNNAAVALMVPIALSLAGKIGAGVDPRPFVVASCIAASASFATPIGYQTNTYVYGVGGYRFGDFARVGLPLNLVCFLVTISVVPMVWQF